MRKSKFNVGDNAYLFIDRHALEIALEKSKIISIQWYNTDGFRYGITYGSMTTNVQENELFSSIEEFDQAWKNELLSIHLEKSYKQLKKRFDECIDWIEKYQKQAERIKNTINNLKNENITTKIKA